VLFAPAVRRRRLERAWSYGGLSPGTRLRFRGEIQRNKDDGDGPPASQRTQDKRGARAIAVFEPRPCIPQADAALDEGFHSPLPCCFGSKPQSAGRYPAVCKDFDAILSLMLSYAVMDRIFYKRLQDKRRNGDVERIGIGVDLDSETLTETALLNPNVEIEDLQLARQRNFVRFHLVQRNAEQLTEPEEDVLGGPWVFGNECDGGLKGIEKEMRLDLHAQPLEVCGGERSFNVGLMNLAAPKRLAKLAPAGDESDAQ